MGFRKPALQLEVKPLLPQGLCILIKSGRQIRLAISLSSHPTCRVSEHGISELSLLNS